MTRIDHRALSARLNQEIFKLQMRKMGVEWEVAFLMALRGGDLEAAQGTAATMPGLQIVEKPGGDGLTFNYHPPDWVLVNLAKEGRKKRADRREARRSQRAFKGIAGRPRSK